SSGGLGLLLVILLFATTRLWVLSTSTIRQSTVRLFTNIGYEYRYARAKGESVYDVHARRAAEDMKRGEILRARGEVVPPADESRLQLEYPPLAIFGMALTTRLAPEPPADWSLDESIQASADNAFRWSMAAVDAATFIALIFLLRRTYPASELQRTARLLTYVLSGLAVYHLLYERF